MTGGEIVGAEVAKAALQGSAKAITGSKAEQAAIVEGAKGTPGFHVAAEARGHLMAARQLAINKLFSPLFWFAQYSASYFDPENDSGGSFAEDMAERLVDVPDDDLTSPKPFVAAEAMSSLAYSLDEPDLKGMYLSLLATASTASRSGLAHPAFTSIIRQLSAPEATVLQPFFAGLPAKPLAQFLYTRPDNGGSAVVGIAASTTDDDGQMYEIPDLEAYLNNWTRLGLVEVTFEHSLNGDGVYDWVEARPEYVRAVQKCPNGESVEVLKGIVRVSAFGRAFAAAAIAD